MSSGQQLLADLLGLTNAAAKSISQPGSVFKDKWPADLEGEDTAPENEKQQFENGSSVSHVRQLKKQNLPRGEYHQSSQLKGAQELAAVSQIAGQNHPELNNLERQNASNVSIERSSFTPCDLIDSKTPNRTLAEQHDAASSSSGSSIHERNPTPEPSGIIHS